MMGTPKTGLRCSITSPSTARMTQCYWKYGPVAAGDFELGDECH